MKETIYIWVIPPNHSENMLALVKIAVLLSLPSFILQIKLSKKSEFNLQGKNWQRLQNCNFHQCQHIFAVAGWNHLMLIGNLLLPFNLLLAYNLILAYKMMLADCLIRPIWYFILTCNLILAYKLILAYNLMLTT